MKLMGWNINQRANFRNQANLPDLIINEIKRLKVDIAVLTEFYKCVDYEDFISKIESLGYTVFLDPRPAERYKNQVLIAVSDKLDVYNEGNIKTFPNEIDSNYPNFLQVTVKYNNAPLTIIGTRMRDMEKVPQFKILNNYLATLPIENKIICIGDFNALRPYCIKHLNFFNEDNIYPDWHNHPDEWSYVFKNYNKAQLDLLAVKGLSVTNEKYDWDYLKHSKSYFYADDYKSDVVGFPDHAVLVADLKFI